MMHELHFMIIPSLGCPAQCRYCFGPNRGGVMSQARAQETLRFIRRTTEQAGLDAVRITFHGGEPLAAGHELFRTILEGLAPAYPAGRLRLNIQSNLWLLDDAFCALFQKHGVTLGTSLDGPEPVNDPQRGEGYFRRTMAGIDLARTWGLELGCIATFTRASAPRWREVADFFLAEQLPFSIHSSVPALGKPNSGFALSPDGEVALLGNLLDYYVEHRKRIAISTFDNMAKGLLEGTGNICTFIDCLGMFLCIDPAGDIYPCQRFCGNRRHRLGNLDDDPSRDDLLASPQARQMQERQRRISRLCGECPHSDYCRGGCYYNALAQGDAMQRDPYCRTYRSVFQRMRDCLHEEMQSEENILAVARHPFAAGRSLLLKKGPFIDIVRPGPHPSQVGRYAKRVVAAVELARGPDAPAVASRLVAMGICRNQGTGEASLAHLLRTIDPATRPLNTLYLHLTFACQLHCTHCYAHAGETPGAELAPGHLGDLIAQARQADFRQVVLTGGEPLLHSRRDEMLAMLNRVKPGLGPMRLVLRTNLALPLPDPILERMAGAFHQVVASIDGSRETHEARRGPGSYDASVANLEAYQRLSPNLAGPGELSIAAVLRSGEIAGEPGWSVRRLAERLGVRRIRFRPLLPLGRAAGWDEPPQSEALGAHLDPMEIIEDGFTPTASCGLGQNLYVEPSGASFPCYSYHRPHALLGNVLERGLAAVLESERFRDLARHTVDTNPGCRSCDYRYLCGGACRAWSGEAAQHDLDAPPSECAGLQQRAANLHRAARAYLELDGQAAAPPVRQP